MKGVAVRQKRLGESPIGEDGRRIPYVNQVVITEKVLVQAPQTTRSKNETSPKAFVRILDATGLTAVAGHENHVTIEIS